MKKFTSVCIIPFILTGCFNSAPSNELVWTQFQQARQLNEFGKHVTAELNGIECKEVENRKPEEPSLHQCDISIISNGTIYGKTSDIWRVRFIMSQDEWQIMGIGNLLSSKEIR